jgi:4-amino-4-deoxy-L-arabinose transferase-like glycosyltransferase
VSATSQPQRLAARAAAATAALPSLALYALIFALVSLTHLTLLRLPYYWDEGGYYIPAALDFYHRWALIPHFTNAHPPLPAILLGLLWRLTGFHQLSTRLAEAAIAAAGLLAVFRLTQHLTRSAPAAVTVTFLTGAYPIWFAQSTLAHADILAAAFTLWAIAFYFKQHNLNGLQPHDRAQQSPSSDLSFRNAAEKSAYLKELSFRSAAGESAFRAQSNRRLACAVLFSLAALSKETTIIQPAALAAMHLVLLWKHRRNSALRRENARWIAALSVPIIPLALWYAYHRFRTGFTFGNPEFLRYNATANFSLHHLLEALHYRFLHLFWQRNIWLPIVLAIACLFLPRRAQIRSLRRETLRTIAILIAANWLAFSILGGALLTRYLLPIYPLILLVCVAIWRERTQYWPWLAVFSAAALVSAIWFNPPTAFAPEDNLTYRDMIVVHQEAIDYINQHFPDATVLTAWPASTELFQPFLGYTHKPIKVTTLQDFTLAEVQHAGEHPERYDTALAFTTHYTSPALARYLLAHPNTRRGQEFGKDLRPGEIAAILGGTIVWHDDRDGEWAAVIRFNRSYEAQLGTTHPLTR